MTILEWAGLGAIALGALIFCARIMKKGLTTLDDDRRQCLEKIRIGERQLAEDRKNISSSDHMRLLRSAMEDLVRLEGQPDGFSISGEGKKLELATPGGKWSIELSMRELNLRSTGKMLHGQGRWLLSGNGCYEQHADPASLMRSLNQHLHPGLSIPGEPEHLARRMATPPRALRHP